MHICKILRIGKLRIGKQQPIRPSRVNAQGGDFRTVSPVAPAAAVAGFSPERVLNRERRQPANTGLL
jgi:hypothetical protein